MLGRIVAVCVAMVLAGDRAAAADCLAPVSGAQVDAALERAELAWSRGDEGGFEAAVQEVDVFDVPCLTEPLAPAVVARLHRVHGLAAFAGRAREDAFAAMRSARLSAPDFKFDTSLLPPGHELLDAYEAAADTPAAPGTRLPAPAHGALLFDGVASRWRPTDRPTLAQVADVHGVVGTSTYLWPADPMVGYPRVPKTRNALAVTAGVAGALFAGLFGASFGTRDAYFSTDPSQTERLDGLRSATAGLAGSGIAFGVAGVGVGIASIAVGAR